METHAKQSFSPIGHTLGGRSQPGHSLNLIRENVVSQIVLILVHGCEEASTLYKMGYISGKVLFLIMSQTGRKKTADY